jgi:hypothetical protein
LSRGFPYGNAAAAAAAAAIDFYTITLALKTAGSQ